MAQDKDERTLGLSPAQVAGSALAAVTGALLASFAGTTGTIIGTAVGSIVATVGAAIYTWSLRRTSAAVVRTAAQVRQAALINAALPRPGSTGAGRSRKDQRPESSDSAAAEEAVANADADVAEAAADAESARRSIPWGKALLASAAVAVASLGGITAFEAITGQPISSLLGGSDSKGTSVGNFVSTENSADQDPVPTEPSTTPTEEESQTPSPDAEPSTETVEPTPTETPSEEPTETAEPTEEPSVAPDGEGDQPVVPNDGAAPEGQPGSDADGGADAGAGAAPDTGSDAGSETTN